MNLLKDLHKKYILGFILLTLVVLIVITAVQPGTLKIEDKTDYVQKQAQALSDAKQYEQLLTDVGAPTQAQSTEFMKKIVTEDVVKNQVTSELNVTQPIKIPVVADSELKISPRKDQAAVANYLVDLGSMVTNYNDDVQPESEQIFTIGADPESVKGGVKKTEAIVENLKKMEVPVDAVPFHKANIIAYQKYGELFSSGTEFATDPESKVWPNVFEKYSVINDRFAASKIEIAKLKQKYALNDAVFAMNSGNPFINVAYAGFPVIDIWQVVLETVKTVLARAFAQFFTKMMDKLVAAIDKNFGIVSQLYYSNELDRVYSLEYLKKFVKDPLDQDIIKKFLPETFCVPTDPLELKKIFLKKAQINAAPNLNIDPKDPKFLDKMFALVADPKNTEYWYEDYYQTFAAKTLTESKSATVLESTGTDKKSARDLITQKINIASSKIFHVQESALSGTINIGTTNTQNIVSSIVASLLQAALNKFIFTPLDATASVISESSVCLKNALIKPVVPSEPVGYEKPGDQAFPSPDPTGTATGIPIATPPQPSPTSQVTPPVGFGTFR